MKKKFKVFSLLMLALVMSLSLVACGQGNGNGEPTDEELVFTYAIGGEPNVLDPAVGTDNVTAAITRQMYYPLFSIGSDGSLVKEAVEDYTISDDGLVYTFKLVEENYWSDGKKVTAEDYVFGMKRSVGMGKGDSYYSYFLIDYIKNAKDYGENMADIADMVDIGIEATDERTIVITLEKPTVYFINLMTESVFFPLRSEFAKEHESNWSLDPTVPTNGPFQTTKFDSAEEVILVKNEHYPFADKVNFDKLVAKVMPDMDAQLLAFQNGEIDMATSVSSDVTKIYKDKEELVVTESVINYFVILNAYSESAPELANVNVRKALQMAINRDDIVLSLDAGEAFYPLYGLVPVGLPGLSGDFREEQDAKEVLVKYDPEAAKALLAEEGFTESNPLKLTYYYNQNAMHDTVSQVMQQNWAEIGVQVELKTGEVRTFFDDRQNGLYEMARHAMSADYMDVSNYLDMAASWTLGGKYWGDAKFDELMLETQGETDPAKRFEMLHNAEKYLVQEQAYTIPLFGYSSLYLLKPGVTGIQYNPQGGYSLAFTNITE